MDRRTKWFGFVVLVFLLVSFLVIGLRPRGRSRGFGLSQLTNKTEPTSQAFRQSKRVMPAPSISLQINSDHELTVFAGTPLILTVRLGNRGAQNAALRNEAAKHHAEQLQDAKVRGEISQERAEKLLARIGQPWELPVVRVGDGALGWEHFVHFYLQLPGGQRQALPWPLSLAASPSEKSLTLDAKNTGQVEFLLSPSTAAELAAGVHQILATLEVSLEEKVPGDSWHGLVQSAPVMLTVVQKPAHLTRAEEE